MADQDRLARESAVRAFLAAVGEDTAGGETAHAPRLVAEATDELLNGIGQDPASAIQPLESRAEGGITVEVRDLWFVSFCPHHLLPYTGLATVRYAPREGRVAGLGDFARALELAAHRFVLQETLTESLARAVFERLAPAWVEVRVEATQLCLSARGARAVGSSVVTVSRRERQEAEA